MRAKAFDGPDRLVDRCHLDVVQGGGSKLAERVLGPQKRGNAGVPGIDEFRGRLFAPEPAVVVGGADGKIQVGAPVVVPVWDGALRLCRGDVERQVVLREVLVPLLAPKLGPQAPEAALEDDVLDPGAAVRVPGKKPGLGPVGHEEDAVLVGKPAVLHDVGVPEQRTIFGDVGPHRDQKEGPVCAGELGVEGRANLRLGEQDEEAPLRKRVGDGHRVAGRAEPEVRLQNPGAPALLALVAPEQVLVEIDVRKSGQFVGVGVEKRDGKRGHDSGYRKDDRGEGRSTRTCRIAALQCSNRLTRTDLWRNPRRSHLGRSPVGGARRRPPRLVAGATSRPSSSWTC